MAVGSPHILQVSGIGPFDRLEAAGVTVRHYLSGIGKSFQDHLHYRSRWEIGKPLTLFGQTAEELTDAQRQFKQGRGPLATNGFGSDACVMPRMNTGHPNAPVIMNGEKGADLIMARNQAACSVRP